METATLTRRERRAMRKLRFVTSSEARQAARLARLDYKVPGESGALRLHTHSLTWHLGAASTALHHRPDREGTGQGRPTW